MEPDNVPMPQPLPDLCLLVDQLLLPPGQPGGGDDLGGELLAGAPAHAPLDGAEGALAKLLLQVVVVGEVVAAADGRHGGTLLDLDRDDYSSAGCTRHPCKLEGVSCLDIYVESGAPLRDAGEMLT